MANEDFIAEIRPGKRIMIKQVQTNPNKPKTQAFVVTVKEVTGFKQVTIKTSGIKTNAKGEREYMRFNGDGWSINFPDWIILQRPTELLWEAEIEKAKV